jgi:hypothetical protein
MDRKLISPVARVVFGEPIDAESAEREERLVKAVFGWMDRSSRQAVHAGSSAVGLAVRALSAPNILRLAERLDARCPEAIPAVPMLAEHMQVLALAERTARFFSQENLESLRQALADEGDA